VLVLRSITWHKGNLDKLIAKVGVVCHCAPLEPAAAAAWTVRQAADVHGRAIAKDAATLLVRRLGVDLLRLDAELGKIAASTEEGQEIDVDLVEAMTGKASDEKAYVVQRAMLEAIARDGAPAAMASLIGGIREVVELAGESQVAVMYFVGDLMRKLYLAAHLRRQGVGEGQMAKRLRLWGIDKPFFEAQRRLSGPATGRLFDAVVDLDRRSKSGLGDPAANLERFCTMLADELHTGAAR
jgi:DNA polymerase III delta subunit